MEGQPERVLTAVQRSDHRHWRRTGLARCLAAVSNFERSCCATEKLESQPRRDVVHEFAHRIQSTAVAAQWAQRHMRGDFDGQSRAAWKRTGNRPICEYNAYPD